MSVKGNISTKGSLDVNGATVKTVEDPEGRFESQTDSVKFEAKDLKGGSGWFQGKAEKVKDFFLKGRN